MDFTPEFFRDLGVSRLLTRAHSALSSGTVVSNAGGFFRSHVRSPDADRYSENFNWSLLKMGSRAFVEMRL